MPESDWAERRCGVMAAFGGDHRMQYSPFAHPPMAYRFLVNFERTRLAERQRVGDTA